MSVPVRISESMYNEAKSVASGECRSITNQIEFWARIGKCALENPDLPINMIKDIMISKHTDQSAFEPFDMDSSNE